MKFLQSLALTVLTTVTFTSFTSVSQANETFGERSIKQDDTIAIAVPFGHKNYSLTLIQQVPDREKCWQEIGSNPVNVDPLLLNFDFTGSCFRATDSNGYSIRLDGVDRSGYSFNIVERNGELLLIATNIDPNVPELLIGRSYGIANGNKSLTKIFLHPDWKITKRTYQGKTLGHFYFSGSSNSNNTAKQPSSPQEFLEPIQ